MTSRKQKGVPNQSYLIFMTATLRQKTIQISFSGKTQHASICPGVTGFCRGTTAKLSVHSDLAEQRTEISDNLDLHNSAVFSSRVGACIAKTTEWLHE